MAITFNINGSSVNPQSMQRTSILDVSNAYVIAVYQAFVSLNAHIPLTSLSISGNAVACTAVLTLSTGATLTYGVTLDAATMDPIVTISTTSTWRLSQLGATKQLFDSVVNLIQTAHVGTLFLTA